MKKDQATALIRGFRNGEHTREYADIIGVDYEEYKVMLEAYLEVGDPAMKIAANKRMMRGYLLVDKGWTGEEVAALFDCSAKTADAVASDYRAWRAVKISRKIAEEKQNRRATGSGVRFSNKNNAFWKNESDE
jgi:hypothetical protein